MLARRIAPLGWTFTAVSIMYSGDSLSQSTPSEFAEMSLVDLLDQSIDESELSHRDQSSWSFVFQRQSAEFKDFLDGDNRVSEDDVLWSGPNSGEARTDKNFPVVPGKITQTAYLISIGYAFDDRWRGHITVPYLEQSTDHISIVPNYSTFKLDSSGVGDTMVSASYRLSDTNRGHWWLTVGLSIPTGSIDAEGDTPRAPGDQRLPYTMQLGSGTYDFPVEISYHNRGQHDISVALAALIRTGTNDNDYRLGNSYSLTSRYDFHFSEILQPYISLNIDYSDSIHGADTSLMTAPPYPYPAPITNPDLFGGIKIGARAGISWQVSDHYRLAIEVGKPIYQNLNGPQTEEDWRSSLQISRSF
ncbi:MAG: hypothetical protein P8J79_12505 [Halioglobus sp.]|nr:hypothetical protein [Halioglobus sp.]